MFKYVGEKIESIFFSEYAFFKLLKFFLKLKCHEVIHNSDIKGNMRTIMMIERPENAGKMIVDFQLIRANMHYAPFGFGIIRIARFETAFNPKNCQGYYGDIYFKRFIRKWRKWTSEIKQRRIDRFMGQVVLDYIDFMSDIQYSIMEFL